MSAAIQTTLFDYAELDSETRIVVQQRTTEIKALMKRAASDIIEIGQKLIEVRAKLIHGEWLPWLRDELGCSPDTAQRLIRVATAFDQKPQIAAFDPSALYLLAAPSTPDSARDEALERAEAGEPITHSKAQAIIADHRDPVHPFISDEDFDRQITEAEYEDDDEPLSPREEEIARQETARRQQIAVITGSSESNEWYTPTHIIECARTALGGIDFDPASSITANTVVRADAYCTVAENGYAQAWYGRVWLNPPYGREEGEIGTNAMRWSRKLIAEYGAGHVTAAILLVKAALGYNWFEELWYAWPTCLLRERLSFMRPDGSDDGQSKHATALIYFGDKNGVARFRTEFRSLGRVILPENDE